MYLSGYSCSDQVELYKHIFCFKRQMIPYNGRIVNFTSTSSEAVAIALANNNSLKSQEDYSNVASRLSILFSFSWKVQQQLCIAEWQKP